VDFAHFPPARPLGLHTDAGEPILFGQYRMRDRETRRESARLLKIDSEAEHHAAVHIDDHGQRRSLDRLAVFLINHNDIHGRVVDLNDG